MPGIAGHLRKTFTSDYGAAMSAIIKSISFEGLPGFSRGGCVTLAHLGKVTSLVGPNSSGKTTLLRAASALLSFLHESRFSAGAVYTKGEWCGFALARVTVVGANGCPLPMVALDEYLGLQTASVVIEVVCTPSDTYTISKIASDAGDLVLSNPASPYVFNPASAEIEQCLAQVESQLRDLIQRRNGLGVRVRPSPERGSQTVRTANPGRDPQFIQKLQLQAKRLDAEIRGLQDKKADYEAQLARCRQDFGGFRHNPGGGDVSLRIGDVERCLKAIGFPSTCSVAVNQLPVESIDTFLSTAIASKIGEDTSEHERLEAELENLIEGDVRLFEADHTQQLTVNRIGFQELSHGASLCVRLFALTEESREPVMLLWDEPENGLHATRRVKLLHLMKRSRHQYIVATHATELCDVLDGDCEVYRLAAEYDQEAQVQTLSVNHATSRRGAFVVAEELGIRPASTLFTANVVLWVEGPTELVFWRHWIREVTRSDPLLEGFDYSILMFGGKNVAHLALSHELDGVEGFDVLSLCQWPIVIVDSDFAEPPEGDSISALKPEARCVAEAVARINADRENCALFLHTPGREIENYLPCSAIAYACQELGHYTSQELQQIALDELQVGQWDHYFEALDKHITSRGVTTRYRDITGAKGRSQWGSGNKVEFMRTALRFPGLSVENLRFGGKEQIDTVVAWIRMHRVA